MNSTRDAAQRLLDALPLSRARLGPARGAPQQPGTRPRARGGARGGVRARAPRGVVAAAAAASASSTRARVHELLRHVAHAEREEFHVVLLDVRGRLIRRVAGRGGLADAVPRVAARRAPRAGPDGAHGVVFVHNHPSSGDPSPSAEDADLTERLRAASELVGVVARDHVIVAASGYYSFVEAGRWRR